MKNLTGYLLFILLVISGLAYSQTREHGSLLWKITGDKISQPSYLYGTIHIICQENIKIGNAEVTALADADKVFLELDLDSPELVNQMRVAAHNKTHLRNHISSKGYNEIDDFFTQQLGYSMEAVGMIKPYYLISYTYKPIIGCSNPLSIEELLVNEAKHQGKEVAGLETLAQQTSVFDNLSTQKQARLLLRQIRKSHLIRENYEEILNLYQRGDVEQLNRKIVTSPSRRLNRKLLNGRNQAWVKKLTAELPQQSNFIAVGAAHLGGEKGLIQQLRRAGYTVEAVK